MKKATVHLKSVSPYSPSRYHNTDKLEKESHDDYERRTGFDLIPYGRPA